MESVEVRKVFISYSWSSEEIKQKVLDLAKSLVDDGVEVVLDRWDLNVGQDKFKFMEQMVTDDTVNRVLIISDSVYAEKADSRQGGVGTETQIITPEIYQYAGQNRFIPIVFERDSTTGEACLPTYAKARMYIDLSDVATFQEEYIRLVREIYEKPDLKKPKIGKTPSYILDDSIDSFSIERKAKEVENASINNPKRLSFLIKDFLDTFIQELEKLVVDKKEDEAADEAVVRMIHQSLPFRQGIVKIMNVTSQNNDFDEMLLDFFEDFNNRVEEIEKEQPKLSELTSQAIKFLLNEVFIIAITIFIRYRNWVSVTKLTNYFYYDEGYSQEVDFVQFRKPLRVIYGGELEKKSKKISLQAEIMKERASSAKEFREMVEADLFLHYVSMINPNINRDWYGQWFPVLYIYLGFRNNQMKIVSLLKSKDSLQKILPVFSMTKEEFEEKIMNVKVGRGYSNSFESIPSILKFIKKEEIGTRP